MRLGAGGIVGRVNERFWCLKGALALNPRGKLYTEENVKGPVWPRDLLSELRDGGLMTGGPPASGRRTARPLPTSSTFRSPIEGGRVLNGLVAALSLDQPAGYSGAALSAGSR